MSSSFKVYRDNYSLVINYKKLNTKEEKTTFNTKFKLYDQAKKDLNVLKKIYNIDTEKGLIKN